MFDIHVATDVVSDLAGRNLLHAQLLDLGFHDDELKENGLTFDAKTAKQFETCPLIDIHMSKKVANREECAHCESLLHKIMSQAVPPGYWHAECVPDSYDRKYIRLAPKFDPLPWFCKPLRLNANADRFKVWDLHVAMAEDEMDETLKRTLIDHGIYFLSRWKTRNNKRKAWAVFTVQGTSGVHEGLDFFDALVKWLEQSGAPDFDAKLEITTKMEVYRNPQRVPPTVETIEYV